MTAKFTLCLGITGLVSLFVQGSELAGLAVKESAIALDRLRSITNALKVGLTSERVNEIVSQQRPGEWDDCGSSSNRTGLLRYGIGAGIYLITGYSDLADPYCNIRTNDTLSFFRAVQFADLKEEIPPGLFESLRLVHLAPTLSQGDSANPADLIRAVNALHALGKDRALQALREYYRLSEWTKGFDDKSEKEWQDFYHRAFVYALEQERVFVVALLLFVRPDPEARMPFGLGTRKEWPYYPLGLSDDIPFLLISGYALGGSLGSVSQFLDCCEQKYTFRDRPLAPTGSPLTAVQALLASKEWKASGVSDFREDLLRRQAIRSAQDLLLPTIADYRKAFPSLPCALPITQESWLQLVLRADQMKIGWDPNQMRFVRTSK